MQPKRGSRKGPRLRPAQSLHTELAGLHPTAQLQMVVKALNRTQALLESLTLGKGFEQRRKPVHVGPKTVSKGFNPKLLLHRHPSFHRAHESKGAPNSICSPQLQTTLSMQTLSGFEHGSPRASCTKSVAELWGLGIQECHLVLPG